MKRRTLSIEPGRFAYERLDRVLHERARLGIMTSLVARPEGVAFRELTLLCSLTDGNLSRHLAVLHQAGLVEIWKGYENRRPQTRCLATRTGRRKFLEYLMDLERIVRDAMPRAARRARPPSEPPAGWTRL